MSTDRFNLGFTGSSKRVTPQQGEALRQFLTQQQFTHFHHGDCVNADALAHRLVREVAPEAIIEVHPCTLDAMRAYCDADVLHQVKPPLDRNDDIVQTCGFIVAISDTFKEKLRSGTWATIRRARKAGRPTFVIWPDGRIEELTNLC